MREFWEVMHVMPAFCVSENVCVLAPAGRRIFLCLLPHSSVLSLYPRWALTRAVSPSVTVQRRLSAPQSVGEGGGKVMTEGRCPKHTPVCFSSQASLRQKCAVVP